MQGPSDQDLIEQCRDPKQRAAAFGLIVKRYQERVYYMVRRMVIDHDDANDVVQDAFIKAYKALPKFRGDSQLYTWLYRIASNIAIDHLNKKKRFLRAPEELEERLAATIDNGPHYSGNEIQNKLEKAVLTLPDKQRLVFQLKYYEELKYQNISEITGTSVGALKASYHIAVKKIVQIIKADQTF